MNLPDVAKWQKILLFIILGMVMVYIANIGLAVSGNLNSAPPAGSPQGAVGGLTALALMLNAVYLALVIGAIVTIVLLSRALGFGVAMRVLCALLMFCPIVNLFTLLVINGKATGALQAGGYKVGLMGVQGPAA